MKKETEKLMNDIAINCLYDVGDFSSEEIEEWAKLKGISITKNND